MALDRLPRQLQKPDGYRFSGTMSGADIASGIAADIKWERVALIAAVIYLFKNRKK